MLFELLGNFRRKVTHALFVGVIFAGVSAMLATPVFAAPGINHQLNFQGRLLNAQGATAPDGYYNVQFKIYQDGTGAAVGNPDGTLKWTESWLNNDSHGVRVVNGYISVQLGSITPFGSSIDWNQDTLWLSVNIGSTNTTCSPFTSCGGDGEMIPMKRLSAVPYALNAAQLGGLSAAGFVQNTTTVQTSTSMAIDGTARADTAVLTPSLDTNTAAALNIGTANATVINLNQNVTVAAGKSLTLAGGNTASRPASPTEGMLYFDSETKQLLTYANGKWQGDRHESTKIVAASNSSQAMKDAADYVATGTGDQGVINAALTAAAGGKVYLMEGTYTINASISVPNNTTLAGAGAGTVITIPNGFNSSVSAITNTDASTGANIVVRDLMLDGNKANQTIDCSDGCVAHQSGVVFTNTGSGSGVMETVVSGAKVNNIQTKDWYDYGIILYSGANNSVTNNIAQGNGYGIALTGMGFNNIMSKNAAYASVYDGLTLTGGSQNTVSDNTSESNAGYGLYFSSASSTVSHNTISWNLSDGMYLNGVSLSTIKDNTLTVNHGKGMNMSYSTDNSIMSNILYQNGSLDTNNSLFLLDSDRNTITDNTINGAGSVTNFDIDISDAASSANYLASNTLNGGGIHDLGTDTVYGGQTNDTGNFLIQPAGTIELMKNTNVTGTLSASTSVLTPTVDTASAVALNIGTATTNAINIGKAGVTTTIAGNTGVTLNGTTGTTMVCRNATGLLSTCDATYLAPTATNFIQNGTTQQASSNFNISGTGQAATFQASTSVLTTLLDTSSAAALNIGTTNANAINLNQNVTVAAGKSLTLAGGATATRPASPTEGMLYYDTDTKQLLNYANGKWQADRSTSTKIVAASNSSQALKDAADYVATGTGDQTIINNALTAAAGGKVYLTEGTFTLGGSINIPNNTTLAGAGRGTLITMANSTNLTGITNTTAGGNGTGIVIQDLRLDGNKANQTSGNGIYFTGVGSGSGSSAVQGAKISGVWANNWYGDGIWFNDSFNSTITGTSAEGNNGRGINLGGFYYYDTNNTVSNNIVQGNTSDGIYVGYTNANTVTGNVVQSNGGVGIYLSAAKRTTVTGNVVQENGYGIAVSSLSANNTVSGNDMYNNGGTTTNNGIYVNNSDYNIITGNTIADTSGTTSNYAININSATADNNYLADNLFRSTPGTATIRDLGTGTVYANQPRSENGGQLTNRTANNTEAFAVQNASGTNMLAVDSTNSKVLVAGTLDTTTATTLNIGTATATAISIGKAGVTTTIAGDTGVTLNATTGTTIVCRNATGLLSTCDATYLAPTATNFIQNGTTQQASSNFNISGTGQAATFQASTSVLTTLLDTSSAVNLNIGTSTASSVTIAKAAVGTTIASNTITVGSATATPANTNSILGAAQTNNNTAGNAMVIQGSTGLGNGAGGNVTIQGGTSGTTGTVGGTLTLAGGTAASGNGGNVTITGGSATGGTMGLVSLNPTFFASSAVQSYTTAGINNVGVSLVDSYSTIPATASVAGVIMVIPDPTITANVGRILYIAARNGSQDFTLRLNSTRTAININLKANSTATLIWNGTDWTAAGASSATDLQAAYNNTQSAAGGAEIVLKSTLDSPAGTGGLTIRNNSSVPISGGLLEIQTSIGTNLFSVNSYGTELAANGGAETAGASSTTFPASTWSAQGATTVSRSVTVGEFQTGEAGVKVATNSVNQGGVRNQLSSNPVASTYTVSFTAASSTAGQDTTTLEVFYSPDGGTTVSNRCTGFGGGQTNTRTISNYTNYNWTKVTCTITTTVPTGTPLLIIRQTDATNRTLYIDNLSFIRNDSTTRPANVQMGGGNTGGQVTLFTLDRSSTAPLVSNGDDRYIGSMYYDTTLGNIQCYEADGWGACGSAPDNIVTFTPEYTGAVLNGSGVGTMTADFCGNGGGLSVNTSFCASGEARNYYRWTSPQATSQTYSIYVSYRLPSTFKTFVSGTTSLTGLVDNTANAGVSYSIFRKQSGGGLTSCSTSRNVVGSGSGSINTWTTVAPTSDPSGCTFAGGDTVVIQITVTAQSNASAYVENLTFRYQNN